MKALVAIATAIAMAAWSALGVRVLQMGNYLYCYGERPGCRAGLPAGAIVGVVYVAGLGIGYFARRWTLRSIARRDGAA